MPPVMQDECGEIYSAVLHNTIHGYAAERQLNEANTVFLGMIFGPESQDENGKENTVFLFNLLAGLKLVICKNVYRSQ